MRSAWLPSLVALVLLSTVASATTGGSQETEVLGWDPVGHGVHLSVSGGGEGPYAFYIVYSPESGRLQFSEDLEGDADRAVAPYDAFLREHTSGFTGLQPLTPLSRAEVEKLGFHFTVTSSATRMRAPSRGGTVAAWELTLLISGPSGPISQEGFPSLSSCDSRVLEEHPERASPGAVPYRLRFWKLPAPDGAVFGLFTRCSDPFEFNYAEDVPIYVLPIHATERLTSVQVQRLTARVANGAGLAAYQRARGLAGKEGARQARQQALEEAERLFEGAVNSSPTLHVAWTNLASTLALLSAMNAENSYVEPGLEKELYEALAIAGALDPALTLKKMRQDQDYDGVRTNPHFLETLATVEKQARERPTPTHTKPSVCARSLSVRSTVENALRKPCAEISTEDLARLTAFSLHIPHWRGDPTPAPEGSVQPGDLAGFSGVEELILSSLQRLSGDAFRDLKSLTVLNLSMSRLKTLPEGLFASTPHVRRLDFSDGRLERLPEGIFRGLSELEDIQLQDNPLKAIPPGLFSQLPNLRRVRLPYQLPKPVHQRVRAELPSSVELK